MATLIITVQSVLPWILELSGEQCHVPLHPYQTPWRDSKKKYATQTFILDTFSSLLQFKLRSE